MASLPARTTSSFDAIKPVLSLTLLDNEFNQYVGASGFLNGGSTATKLLVKTSDGTDPPVDCDQLGAGLLARWKQNGSTKVSISNAGLFTMASTAVNTGFNADLLDGHEGAEFALLASNRVPWSGTFFYLVIPGATETTETVGRLIIPANNVRITNVGISWASGSASGAANTWTIKRRNSAGTLQADIGTATLGSQNAFANANVGPITCSFGDQIYALLTTRNAPASETLISVVVNGDKLLA